MPIWLIFVEEYKIMCPIIFEDNLLCFSFSLQILEPCPVPNEVWYLSSDWGVWCKTETKIGDSFKAGKTQNLISEEDHLIKIKCHDHWILQISHALQLSKCWGNLTTHSRAVYVTVAMTKTITLKCISSINKYHLLFYTQILTQKLKEILH